MTPVPETWDVVGHEMVVRALQAAIAHRMVAHAYLVTGPAQVGKRHLVAQLTLALLCTRSQSDPLHSPDRTCVQCQHVLARAHPDVHVLVRQPDRRDILIEQVRAVQERIAMRPYQAERAVVIIEDAELLNESAANALLKTLEEPPAHTIMLLTASDPDAVLPTIASRCQHAALRPVPVPVIAAGVRQRLPHLPAAEIQRIAALADGRPGWALAMAADPARLAADQAERTHITALCQSPTSARFAVVADRLARGSFNENRQAALLMLYNMLSWWRDLLMVVIGTPHLVRDDSQIAALERVAATVDRPAVTAALLRVRQAIDDVEHNLTPRLVMEELLLYLPGAPHTPARGRRP